MSVLWLLSWLSWVLVMVGCHGDVWGYMMTCDVYIMGYILRPLTSFLVLRLFSWLMKVSGQVALVCDLL